MQCCIVVPTGRSQLRVIVTSQAEAMHAGDDPMQSPFMTSTVTPTMLLPDVVVCEPEVPAQPEHPMYAGAAEMELAEEAVRTRASPTARRKNRKRAVWRWGFMSMTAGSGPNSEAVATYAAIGLDLNARTVPPPEHL